MEERSRMDDSHKRDDAYEGDEPYTRVYAEIDLDAIRKNMEVMCHGLPEEVRLIGVVKTDGYGHGAVPVAKAIGPYVWGYAVAAVEEAEILRRHQIRKPILVLGSTHERHFRELIEGEIRPAVFQEEKAARLSELAVSIGRRAKIHIALDTGMSRIGFQADETSLEAVCRIAAMPGIEIEGLFTHFSRADEEDKTFTRIQYERYCRFAEALRSRGVVIPICHCANSAAIMELPQMGMDAARAGISMYGLYPSEEVSRDMKLCPAMTVRSFITFIKEIGAGTPVSYGGTFVAERPMRIATVSAGYGDGYPRNLSGRGYVLVCGKRAPILGRVCMDQFMIDVTDIPEAKEEMRVTLVGRDKDEVLSMEELAAMSGGFHYEIPCILGKRVPRVYLQGGHIVGTKDYNDDLYRDFL